MLDVGLRYFLEVVRCGSISGASQRLNVAGSAISRQIAKLEDEVGTALFERRPRGMLPSAAGRILADYARRTALEADRTAAEIRELPQWNRGTVRIASMEGSAMDLLPHAFLTFNRRHAGVRFDLTVLSPGLVARRVSEGEADIGITFSLAPERDIRVEYAMRAPVLALMSDDHPLAGRGSITIADLKHHPLALPTADTTLRQLFDLTCAAEGLLIEPVLVCNYMPTLNNFARAGGGIALTGRLSVARRLDVDRLVLVPIDNPGMQQRRVEIQTMAGRTLPHAVKAFLDHLIEEIRALENLPG